MLSNKQETDSQNCAEAIVGLRGLNDCGEFGEEDFAEG